jgi:hypothetical protein
LSDGKGDNEMIRGLCTDLLHLPYGQGKPQLGDRLMKAVQLVIAPDVPLRPNDVSRIVQRVREGEGKKTG